MEQTGVKRTAACYPSADEINALPEKFRRYIHDLETRCDKSATFRRSRCCARIGKRCRSAWKSWTLKLAGCALDELGLRHEWHFPPGRVALKSCPCPKGQAGKELRKSRISDNRFSGSIDVDTRREMP
jgi:hypothetical protein